jgi:hypothetical protein
MVLERQPNQVRVCPKTGRPISARRHRWVYWVLPLTGLLSLVWFLVRVIPKPSRAAYPCQRVAAPLASAFVVWVTGIVGSCLAYRRARRLLGQARYVAAAILVTIAVGAIWMSLSVTQDQRAGAAFTPSDPANTPIGVGKGIHPGRVAWMYEPRAALWDGKTGRWWDEENTDQSAVDYMVSKTLRTFTGEPNDAAAWDALFRYFNRTRGLGDAGYAKGEKIAIKINMNQDSGGAWAANAGMPSPQMLYSLIDHLVNVVGVSGRDITIYDAARYIGDPLYNKIRGNPDPNFQQVTFAVVPNYARNGRMAVAQDTANPIRFAGAGVAGGGRAYPPRQLTAAKYLINMALFRAHSMFGITFCGKNHFGSIYWSHINSWTPEPIHNYGNRSQPMGTCCAMVDLIGHPHLGGKTLLYLIDAVYGARNQSAEVMPFASFGNKWTSSIFMSQDPVAIDSVALDFVRNESKATDCTGPGVDNYLHEAALANDPPSRSVYDPDGDGKRLDSLGVHEHWNNPTDRKYSRNLGMGEGIELVIPSLTSDDGPVQNVTKGTRYDFISQAVQDANEGDSIIVAPGTYRETVDFLGKSLIVQSEDPNDPNVVAATIIAGQGVVFANGETGNSRLAGFTITGATQGLYCRNASPIIANCRIVDNAQAGVKLLETDVHAPTFINCIVAGNGGSGIDMVAPKGGRLVKFNLATILQCTIVGNAKEGILGSKPLVANSIVYANALRQISTDGATVAYCDVQGDHPGNGNIDADPCFVTPGYWADVADPNVPAAPGPAAVWVGGDYHLSADSPCIDAGSGLYLHEAVVGDIDGDARHPYETPDIGCDEFVK